MLGRKEHRQPELFVAGSPRELLPDDHVLVRVDRVLDLGWLHEEVADLYDASTGRPSIDPDPALGLLGPFVQMHVPERVLSAGQRDRLVGLAGEVVLLDREPEVGVGLAADLRVGPARGIPGNRVSDFSPLDAKHNLS
jgi:hypothetical protein